MSTPQRVLIVDQSPESREVLRTALERRGAEILEANRAQQGLAMVAQRHPDVIVLDLDGDDDSAGAAAGISAEFGRAIGTRQIPIVVLGTARRQMERVPTGEFVAKPYHYGPLVRRIEGLLGRLG